MLYSIQIKSRQPAVSSVVADIEALLPKNGLDQEEISDVSLILAEALNNVVEHAYGYASDGEINIRITLEHGWLIIEINDTGPEFSIPEASTDTGPITVDFDDLPEGQFGWNLIQMLTDKISLERCNDRNILKLYKVIAPKNPT